ncbi:selenocysteine-specific translation elongation factor [Paractinoplanes brasiliensis]|uniref:Selenocysteine-specific elongation factor n=1 Tax=Paractinoplanes brasiliensis TaxID=52695 RepID=A0A4R6K1Z4_9ACTN|nr:selenocysteine-specific translation elongation factor [Actinoplanes brasiliensis]TDO42332.1 selenocysteine-specific elongation factor [Actinoplanes brasiliensis]GID29563.1 selenocysteine-specific translation elongation factor [Actinoplanes brasiliensis]
MHVVATAGHVDHGKSTLVRALTGMEPDRWAEERRRGMTIDLGFAWTTLGSGETVAFVDVPGHERFVPNMLAGIGPVPAAMIVVAADEGWMPQSAEHLAALTALDVRHGLLVVTRSDLADPGPALEAARAEIASSPLGAVPTVAVSGVTGAGLDDLRAALASLIASLPAPDVSAPVRLWIDRAFTVKGAGTVVTGTLGAGTLRTGDELTLGDGMVRVRGLQSLGKTVDSVNAVARVAVNLRGTARDEVGRGDALLTPGRFRPTDLIDVRLHGDPVAALPATVTLHAGSAAVPVRVRPLGPDTARLRLPRPLPLRIGDRLLLRDPGRHHVAGGVTVLDVAPPGLKRRGAAAARAVVLTTLDGRPSLDSELTRRLLIRAPDLAAMGVPLPAPTAPVPGEAPTVPMPGEAPTVPMADEASTAPITDEAPTAPITGEAPATPVAGDWYANPAHWASLGDRLPDEVATYQREHPLEPGMPIEALRHRLGLPDRALVTALVRPPLTILAGRVAAGPSGPPEELVALVAKAFDGLGPFAAPEANNLTALGLGPRQLAAAARNGLVIQLAPQVVLAAGSVEAAGEALAALPQPFTLSEARRALDTTRRVAVPLLELLDRRNLTERLPDDRRRLR